MNQVVWNGTTTNAVQTEIFSNGSRLTLNSNTAVRVQGTAIAVSSSTLVREWEFTALIKNVSGTVSFVGSPSVTDLRGDTGTESWVLTLTADDTNNSLDIKATGAAGTTIQWQAQAELTFTSGTSVSITGYYCSDADIINIIGSAQLTQLSNDTVGALVPDNTVVEAMIERAQSYIDSELGGTYTTPFSPVPDVMKHICTTIAVHNLMLRRFSLMEMPKQWQDEWKDAVEQINQFATLEQRLDPTLYPVIAGSAIMQSPDGSSTRSIDFSSTDNALSQF